MCIVYITRHICMECHATMHLKPYTSLLRQTCALRTLKQNTSYAGLAAVMRLVYAPKRVCISYQPAIFRRATTTSAAGQRTSKGSYYDLQKATNKKAL